jgi:Holliday junction resolvasome RuvABC endonuclease subunit
MKYAIGIDPGKESGAGIATTEGDVYCLPIGWALGGNLDAVDAFARELGLNGPPSMVGIELQHVGRNPMTSLRTARTSGEIAQACAVQWPDAVIIWLSPPEWRSMIGVPNRKPAALEWAAANVQGEIPRSEDAREAAGIARATVQTLMANRQVQ